MSASDNAVLAHRWFDEVWTQRRDATVVELLADPCEGHMEGGDVRGPRDFLAARAALLGAIPDLKVVVEGVIAQGDEVAIRWSASGTHRGDALGPRASGRETLFRGISWMRFQNGRIVEGWDSWNLGRLLDELSRPPADIELPDENPGAAGRG